MIPITYRPIDVWPGTLRTAGQRQYSRFDTSWGDTLELLDRELRALRAKRIVCQLALPEHSFRNDGQPRADARDPEHPGVILAFDSVHGPLKYATDIFRRTRTMPGWQQNVRAIALGLEALRKVDRYGITKRGEQYTGWKALGSGIAMPASTGFSSLEEAAAFLIEHGELELARQAGNIATPDELLEGPNASVCVTGYYRRAAQRLHPDVGGNPEQFKRLGEAKRMLDEARG